MSDSAEPRDETPAEQALRSLASWLGCGGYNAPTVDAKVFEEKIRFGVQNFAALHLTAARDLADAVIGLDMVTPSGLRAKDLARQLETLLPASPPPAPIAGGLAFTCKRPDNITGNEWFEYQAGFWDAVRQARAGSIIAAHSAQPVGQASRASLQAPAGWKLVPVEPTPEMIAAGELSGAYGGFSEEDCYCRMIAAAPPSLPGSEKRRPESSSILRLNWSAPAGK